MKNGAAIIGVAIGVALGTFGAAQIGIQSSRIEAQKLESCWADGGEYRDGKCEMPEDSMSSNEKVCLGMGGQYVMTKRQHAPGMNVDCFKPDGSEIALPDLTGKDVKVMKDGTVSVKGPDRIDYYMGAR